MQRTCDSLRRLDLLSACTEAELGKIRRLVTIVHVAPGSTIHPDGRGMAWLYGLLDGTVRVSVGGQHRTMRVGETYGEHALLVEQPPNDVEIVAVTAATVLTIGRREFLALFASAPNVGYAVARRLASA